MSKIGVVATSVMAVVLLGGGAWMGTSIAVGASEAAAHKAAAQHEMVVEQAAHVDRVAAATQSHVQVMQDQATIAASKPSSVKTEKFSPLSTTQIANFALAYCINVNKHGGEWTRSKFADVAKQDLISPSDQAAILDSASYCG